MPPAYIFLSHLLSPFFAVHSEALTSSSLCNVSVVTLPLGYRKCPFISIANSVSSLLGWCCCTLLTRAHSSIIGQAYVFFSARYVVLVSFILSLTVIHGTLRTPCFVPHPPVPVFLFYLNFQGLLRIFFMLKIQIFQMYILFFCLFTLFSIYNLLL